MSLAFGATSGLLCHFWYGFLDRLLPGAGLRTVTKKVLADQVVFSPVCIAACLTASAAAEGNGTKSKLIQEIRIKGNLNSEGVRKSR